MRRTSIIKKLIEWCSPERKKPRNRTAQEASVDLMRLDLAEWLARDAAGAAHVEVPVQRTYAEAGPKGTPGDRSSAPEQANDAEVEAGIEEPPSGGTPEPPLPVEPEPPAVDQVTAFAKAMTEDIWADVVGNLPGTPEEIRKVRLQLADHGWCDLFIALVKAIERFGKLTDGVAEEAKKFVVGTIVGARAHEGRSKIAEAVVGMIVDKAWAALKTAAVAHSPLFALLSSEDLLRNLRIIAVFICPAPARHEAVRKHAIEPLVGDVRGYVSDEAKEWLAKQFGLRPAGDLPAARETPA